MKELILGIETSCDDTSAAIVDREGNVYSSVVVGQNEVHSQFGGVFPEFASREHIANVLPVIEEAMQTANVTPDDITAIGVTRGPGLVGSILVGLNTASAVGMGWGKKVIGINHLRGHLRSSELEGGKIEYPATVLLVSGGHTFLAYMADRNSIELLGTTRDDSVGEAYDKVGRMIGLEYPAGPAIDKLAKQGEDTLPFPRPLLHKGLEFSFSGLKSAVRRYLENTPEAEQKSHADIASSFVQAVIDILVKKCTKAIKQYPSKSLVMVGGVAASPQLREQMGMICDKYKLKLCLPPIKWSTDNAAMIALATFDYIDNEVYPEPFPQMKIPLGMF